MGILNQNIELFCDGFKMRHQTVFITYIHYLSVFYKKIECLNL